NLAENSPIGKDGAGSAATVTLPAPHGKWGPASTVTQGPRRGSGEVEPQTHAGYSPRTQSPTERRRGARRSRREVARSDASRGYPRPEASKLVLKSTARWTSSIATRLAWLQSSRRRRSGDLEG